MSPWRRSMRCSRLIFRAMTVARPFGVRPISTAPAQRKCRDHLWRRGWNSGTIFPVLGSTPATFGPLWRLQKTQTGYARISALSIPSAAPHNRGSGALEVGGLEPASPRTDQPGRIIMRHRPASPVPPAPIGADPACPADPPLASAPSSRPPSYSPDPQPHRRSATAHASRRQGGRP